MRPARQRRAAATRTTWKRDFVQGVVLVCVKSVEDHLVLLGERRWAEMARENYRRVACGGCVAESRGLLCYGI